ncbi:MAG TPA: S9 family peptidase, partial [Gemmatimonadaceae bacterium]|nr:S9 family peptidase [Gemmatimonadaceae bacterium]
MLRRVTHLLVAALVVPGIAGAQSPSSVAPYIAPAFPEELVAARKADRIAWLAYDHGQRNVYTAAAPDFKPVRITKFLDDDGVVLSDLEISDDGTIVTFLRGGEPNTRGWIANPTSDPNGQERAVWAARTSGGDAWRLGVGSAAVISPDGRMAAFAQDSQIYVYAISRAPRDSIARGLKPLIRAWGRNLSP